MASGSLRKNPAADRTLAAAALLALLAAGQAPAAPPGDFPFGVYDPEGSFADDPDVQIEHLFLPWEDVALETLALADQYARDRGRSVLVTIEPWTWTRDERNTPQFLIAGIEAGDYDENMRGICQALNAFESPVTVRWAHEMEDLSGQFIWAGWPFETYTAAYKRMVDVCRAVAPDVQFVWSPMGVENARDYYPGDDYVDLIGISVFGYEPWEEFRLGGPRTFRDIVAQRYAEVAVFGKPVIVAELGYSGSREYVERWENDVRQDLAGFDLLVAVVYFNQKEVYPWPDGFGFPDWRIGGRVLE